jgi:hypothetical protein
MIGPREIGPRTWLKGTLGVRDMPPLRSAGVIGDVIEPIIDAMVTPNKSNFYGTGYLETFSGKSPFGVSFSHCDAMRGWVAHIHLRCA